MLTTLAFVVLFLSIISLFSTEIQSLVKKIIAIKFVQIVGPLLIISWILLKEELHVTVFIGFCRIFLFSLVYYLSKIISFNDAALIIKKIIVLIILTLLPLLIGKLARKFTIYSFDVTKISLKISVFVFVVVAFLFIIAL